MEYSGSTLDIYTTFFEEKLIERYGKESAAVQAEFTSELEDDIPVIKISIANSGFEEGLVMMLNEIHCKQIVSFLQSHLRGQ